MIFVASPHMFLVIFLALHHYRHFCATSVALLEASIGIYI